MPYLESTIAVQFDKATLGLTVNLMRDQILANIEQMFNDTFQSPIEPRPRHNVILSEQESHTLPVLLYQASVSRIDVHGVRIILQGSREATIWAAYRSLMRITMREVGKRVSGGAVQRLSESSLESDDLGEWRRSGGGRRGKGARVLGLDEFNSAGLR